METKKNNIEFVPKFEKSSLLPRYWDARLDVFASAGITLTPSSSHDPILGKLGHSVGRLAKGSRRRVQINLLYCSPEKSEHEWEATIDAMYASTLQAIVMMAKLGLRDPQKVLARVDWQRKETIDKMQRNNEKMIFLVPHAWNADIPATLMASGGQKMAAMLRSQGNPAFDYIWNTVRRRSGRRTHTCNDGIKPFTQSVRQGHQGCYPLDQNHDAEHSEFVDLFAAYEATLSAIDRLVKVCRARVVPLFSVCNDQTHRLTILARPPMDDLLDASDTTTTRRINEEVEVFVKPRTEQCTRIPKLLKTRKPGRIEPYEREGLFSKKWSKRELVGVPGSLAILRQ